MLSITETERHNSRYKVARYSLETVGILVLWRLGMGWLELSRIFGRNRSNIQRDAMKIYWNLEDAA